MSDATTTDLYEVTMAMPYLREGMTRPATFSQFVRDPPPERGRLACPVPLVHGPKARGIPPRSPGTQSCNRLRTDGHATRREHRREVAGLLVTGHEARVRVSRDVGDLVPRRPTGDACSRLDKRRSRPGETPGASGAQQPAGMAAS
ncbi:hypothetical protein [Streptomyces sp. NPDC001401]|uniref:hypothetical protein n=1 Tax=Streptomyces sp. NPDC001401 TaxID=3364570 RepID=UPI0036A90BA3